jgi:hypothetical protein
MRPVDPESDPERLTTRGLLAQRAPASRIASNRWSIPEIGMLRPNLPQLDAPLSLVVLRQGEQGSHMSPAAWTLVEESR